MRLPLSSICYCGDKPGSRLRDDFDLVAEALEKKYPAVDEVHGFLVDNGLRDALRGNTPTKTRGAFQILNPTVSMFRDLAKGTTPLMRSFKAVAISAGMVYGNPESLTLLQGWGDDWKEKKKLETTIGYKISELKVATVDAGDLVNVAGARPWEARTMPKSRTTEDQYGETVLKKLRDEGKKPATCGACCHQFLSASKTFKNGDFIRCLRCGAFKAKYD